MNKSNLKQIKLNPGALKNRTKLAEDILEVLKQ